MALLPLSRTGEISSHYFRSDLIIDLAEVASDLNKKWSDQVPLRFIHLYCDQLTFSGPLTPQGAAELDFSKCPKRRAYVHIYARSLLASVPEVSSIVFKGVSCPISFRLFFDLCCPASPAGLSVQCGPSIVNVDASKTLLENLAGDATKDTSEEKWAQELERAVAGMRAPGRALSFSAGLQGTCSPCRIPTAELDHPEYGTWLPGLLIHLFDLACSQVMTAKEEIQVQELVSRYRFIIYCTKRSSSLAYLCGSAQTMFDRLKSPRFYPGVTSIAVARFDVPRLSSMMFLDSLKMQMDLLQDLEKTSKSIDDKQFLTKVASTILDAVGESAKEFDPTGDLATEISLKQQELHKSQHQLKTAKEEVDHAAAEFNRGLDKYKDKKKKEMYKTLGIAAVQIGFAIGVAIYSCGSGTAVSAGMVGKAASSVNSAIGEVQKASTLWDTVKTVFKKLATLFEKLGPKLWEAGKQTLAGVSSAENAKDQTMVLNKAKAIILETTADEPLDYLDVMADWRELSLRMDEMFKELETVFTNEVDELKPFRMALRKLCIRGETALEARYRVQERVQSYRLKLAEVEDRKRRVEKIEKMRNDEDLAGNAEFLDLSKKETLHRIRIVQQGIFLDLHSCCESLVYENAWKNFPPIEAGSNMNLESCLKMKVALTKQVTTSTAESPASQGRTLEVNTFEHSTLFPSDWKSLLVSENKLFFDTSPGFKVAERLYRSRLCGLHVSFEGLKRKSLTNGDGAESAPRKKRKMDSPAIPYTVSLGPQFIDRDRLKSSIQFTLPPFTYNHELGEKDELFQTTDTNEWIGPDWRKYNLASIFCQGYLEFDEVAAKEIDWSGVESCKLSFKCWATTM